MIDNCPMHSGDWMAKIVRTNRHLLGEEPQECTCSAEAESLGAIVLDISSMIDDAYPSDLPAETHLWRRCMKIAEETGEVTEALLGLVGENPRKGVTHEMHDLHEELLDVALAALGAVAHVSGNTADPIEALAAHAEHRRVRLRAALADPAVGVAEAEFCPSCGSGVRRINTGHRCFDSWHRDPAVGVDTERDFDALASEAVGHEQVDASTEDTYGNETERMGCLCGSWLYDANADPDEIDEAYRVHVREALEAVISHG